MQRYTRSRGRLAVVLVLFALCLLRPGAARSQQVYVGVADQWNDLLAHGDQWKYVRQNADGFYVNFIEMGWVIKGKQGKNQAAVNQTAALFTHKNAYFESDMNNGVTLDQQAIASLQRAGFTIPYTSLNYGWDAARARNLETYRNGTRARRLDMVQDGPWAIGGDINNDLSDPHPVFTNVQYRAWAAQCDGCSTDGPLGIWANDVGGMRHGSVSMVKLAHGMYKVAVVMLCPYGADQKGYDPSMFLRVGQDCVREHEDAGAIPDIWAVFEYATTIAAVPEQVNGRPISSTTGMAYWLLHHLRDPQRVGRLDVMPGAGITLRSFKAPADPDTEVTVARVTVPLSSQRGKAGKGTTPTAVTRTIHCVLSNSSSWLDLCPVIRATLHAPGSGWTVRYTLDGRDVTSDMLKGGCVCVGARRLLPGVKRSLLITLSGVRPQGGTRPARSAASAVASADLTLELLPNPSRDAQIHQRVILHLFPAVVKSPDRPEGAGHAPPVSLSAQKRKHL